MRDFACPACGQQLTFENSLCLNCGAAVGFDLESRTFLVLDKPGERTTGPARKACANLNIAACNWLATDVENGGELCISCALTRTRPADEDTDALPALAEAEAAKRRLVVELSELELPISADGDPTGGFCFDLLSSEDEKVITGYADGVVTLDLAEGDDVHREQLRVSMAEPYRTLVGHFRHEIGHHFYRVIAENGPGRQQFEELFGDPDSDYQEALDRHYKNGAPPNWQETYVSAYATMHPAEDWAETFAHYLHIRDTLDTAAAFGFAPAGATLATPLAGDVGFDRLIDLWLPLAWSLNMINRSMGHLDLYPFVLPPASLEKMKLVHRLITSFGHD